MHIYMHIYTHSSSLPKGRCSPQKQVLVLWMELKHGLLIRYWYKSRSIVIYQRESTARSVFYPQNVDIWSREPIRCHIRTHTGDPNRRHKLHFVPQADPPPKQTSNDSHLDKMEASILAVDKPFTAVTDSLLSVGLDRATAENIENQLALQ